MTDRESLRDRQHTPQITMLTPGRRALGEGWQLVTIGGDEDEITVERTPTEAPADGKPVIVVNSHDKYDMGYVAAILEAQRGKQAEQKIIGPDPCGNRNCMHDGMHCGRFRLVNEMWHNFIGEKMAWLAGRSSIGAGGMIQREKVHQNPATRPGVQ